MQAAVDRLAMTAPTRAELRHGKAMRRLVEALPADGAIVIVHSPTVVSAYRALIREMRGSDVAAVTRVFSAPEPRDENAVTAGLSLPIVRDGFVDAQREHRRALAQAWRL